MHIRDRSDFALIKNFLKAMTNPFDNNSGAFFVLVNQEGQQSLWPQFVPIPAGWSKKFGPATRQACLKHAEDEWTDMRPKSLIAKMEDGPSHY